MSARYIDANALIDYANNQIDKTITANDIARFPTAIDIKWHYPSKGELPEDDRLVVIYYKGGIADFGSYAKGLNGWHNKFGDSISEPYMWISLKPPEEM